MTLYHVHARKWQNGWELRVTDMGVTWSPTLGEAETRAKEYICSQLETAEDSVETALVPSISADLDRLAHEAHRAVNDADEASRIASAKTRQAVYGLSNAGLSTDEVSSFLGMSQERLRGILTGHAPE